MSATRRSGESPEPLPAWDEAAVPPEPSAEQLARSERPVEFITGPLPTEEEFFARWQAKRWGRATPKRETHGRDRPADPDIVPLGEVAAAIGETERQTRTLLRKLFGPKVIGGTRRHQTVHRLVAEALKTHLVPRPDILYTSRHEGEGEATRGGHDWRGGAAGPAAARAHAGSARSEARGDGEHPGALGAGKRGHRRAGRPLDSVRRVLRAQAKRED